MTVRFLFLSFLLASGALAQPKPLTWNFPIRRPHAGVLLGNGTQGLMLWGGGSTLKITVGRAGFWDHRGGNEFSARTTYQDVKRLLQAGDEAGIKAAFAVPEKTGAPNLGRPQQIGGGRLEVTLPAGWNLQRAVLDLATGTGNVFAKNASGQEAKLVLRQAVDAELAWLEVPAALRGKTTQRLVPSWEHVKSQLEKVGVKAPESFGGGTIQGFVQELPEDDPLAIGYRPVPDGLALVSALGKSARQDVEKRLAQGPTAAADRSNVRNRTAEFWKNYWTTVPHVRLPDPVLQEIVDYGLYKQACATPPQGVACALQGPFNEEYQLPPWSNDYHFNINIQMIYTPALASNRPEHLDPLWKMLAAWIPQMQQNGEKFFGRKGALLLPHAVDDRCRVVGNFWTGTIDHACTAWMAYLAYQHYRYTMDRTVLEKTAWPLLEGAFEGYFAMLEAVPDGKGGTRWSLPISVSPEYGGSGMNAWGRDASFQLAALHRVARILPVAARALGKPIDPRWADVDARLPAYTTVEGTWMPEFDSKGTRIALWEGQDLVGSHRHHSHLGSLFPFGTVDPKDPAHTAVVRTSLSNWTFKGPGAWSGWCVPWASAIWSRLENPEAAVMWLRYWHENYLNEGRGTLHNAAFQGQSLIADYPWAKRPAEVPNREVMQLDAGFGALTAVYELLVQNREDVIAVLPAIHRDWKNFSFENLRAEGAFQISARVENGKTSEIRVKSLAGGTLKLAHGLGDSYTVDGQAGTTPLLERTMQPGQTLVLRR